MSNADRIIRKFTQVTPDYYRGLGDELMAEIHELEIALKEKYPQLVDLRLDNRNGTVGVGMIRVSPGFRGQGVGSAVIKDIQRFAQYKGLPVSLSPEADRGHKSDLKRFYKRHGFYRNFGRKADSRYSSMFGPVMLWKPPTE